MGFGAGIALSVGCDSCARLSLRDRGSERDKGNEKRSRLENYDQSLKGSGFKLFTILQVPDASAGAERNRSHVVVTDTR